MNAATEARPNHLSPLVNEAHAEWIVVDDPTGGWSEGSLVDAARANQLRGRGVTLLPVISTYFRASGVGGYFRRAWGAGYPLSSDVPGMHCPLLVYLDPNYGPGRTTGNGSTSVLHWRARIAPAPGLVRLHGLLRVAADTGQSTAQAASIAHGHGKPVNLSELGEPDARGGWTIGGESQVNVPNRGHYSFGLYGVGPGLRVTWAAVSVTRTSR